MPAQLPSPTRRPLAAWADGRRTSSGGRGDAARDGADAGTPNGGAGPGTPPCDACDDADQQRRPPPLHRAVPAAPAEGRVASVSFPGAAACSVVADAAPALQRPLARLPLHNAARPRRDQELAGHRAWLADRLGRLEPQMGCPRAMRAAAPSDGSSLGEVTQMGFAARIAFPVERPRSSFSGNQDHLGYGHGTALGAAAACPGRAVLSIAGDGGFGHRAVELATAARHGLPVVVAAFDDGAFDNVRRIRQASYGGRLIPSGLRNPDLVRFAESFGAAGFRAATAPGLEARLREAFALRAPALVHVTAGGLPSAWDLIAMPRVRGTEGASRPAPR